jgi:DNA (cytosine-5)-methyltransferase 1
VSLTVGSLFAGIGGFDLGLERAGMTVKWQVEIDPFCRAVLAKHWPDVRRYEDIRTVGAHNLAAVDVLCGGFPCQDISNAGKRAGIAGEQSGLWAEYDRLVGELRPSYVFVENVAALLGRGLGRVLGDLAARGYDAEWDCIPAAAVGAPHLRDRIWIVAYPVRERGRMEPITEPRSGGTANHNVSGTSRPVADTTGIGCRSGRARRSHSGDPWEPEQSLPAAHAAPDARGSTYQPIRRRAEGACPTVFAGCGEWRHEGAWAPEPPVGVVVHGLPDRLARRHNEQQIGALGNAIVPQIAEWIGRRILEAEEAMKRTA